MRCEPHVRRRTRDMATLGARHAAPTSHAPCIRRGRRRSRDARSAQHLPRWRRRAASRDRTGRPNVTRAIDDLNALPAHGAADALRSCCGASRWIRAMIARRPFASIDDALSAADDAWAPLGPDDWREAFSHHPRIGDERGEQPQGARAAAWSAGEQASVATATDRTRAELAQVNRDYEAKV